MLWSAQLILPRAASVLRRARRSARKRWQRLRRGGRRVYDKRHRHSYSTTITGVPSRDELPALLNARGLSGCGAEIGVKIGRYSDYLLTHWRGEKLISIDPWQEAGREEYVDKANVAQDRQDEYYAEASRRLARHDERSEIWRTTSVAAAAKIPDQSLDFAYIDARHDYASVTEDVKAWFPKVREGGILAGHDYVDGRFPQGQFSVKSAVDDFFNRREIPVHSTDGPSVVEMFPSWIVEIPQVGDSLSGT